MINEYEKDCIELFLHELNDKWKDDPFLIAANVGLSVKIDKLGDSGEAYRSFSYFLPDSLSIEIDSVRLNYFWNELYPGCPIDLKYKYACWRELWIFWVHSQFASLKFLLDENWLTFVDTFRDIPSSKQSYISHYFAARATGVMKMHQVL